MIRSTNTLRYTFSISHKKYDLICIGPVAQKISWLAQKANSKIKFQKLYIKEIQTKYEPSMMVMNQQHVPLIKKQKQVDNRLRNEIQKIDAQNNNIIMKNGEKIQYDQLIFSGNDYEWKNLDYYKGLKEAVQTPNTATFADLPSVKVTQLYRRLSGHIIFSLPSQQHFGFQNLFMLNLIESIERSIKNNISFKDQVKITILNQGEELFPFNKEINEMVKDIITSKGIYIVNNYKIQQINHRNRKIIGSKGRDLNYGALYQYLPVKTPKLLENSGIDPFNVNKNTLKNNRFPNIHIAGNITPVPYSFYTMNAMSQVIAKNVTNNFLKSNKQAIYNGYSAFPLWTGINKLRYFGMDYQKTKKYSNIGSNPIIQKILGYDKKISGKLEVYSYYNWPSYGHPSYFWPQKIKQVKKSKESLRVPMHS